MSAKWAVAFVAVVGSACALAQQPGRTAIDPNDPEETRAVVSRAEREQLGLNERTWAGVVHPDVPLALARQKKKPRDPVERLRIESRRRFDEKVYVQVHLRADVLERAGGSEQTAAIVKVPTRVLQALSAAEFHVVQQLVETPALLGFANESALAKLANHPDVVGVCLDDQPMPEAPPIVYESDLPPGQSNDYADEPGVKTGRIRAAVYRALELDDRQHVIVALQPKAPLPELTDDSATLATKLVAEQEAVRALQHRVLATLPANDFWLSVRFQGSPGFGGYVNKEGLIKLAEHPEVKAIGLEMRFSFPSMSFKKP